MSVLSNQGSNIKNIFPPLKIISSENPLFINDELIKFQEDNHYDRKDYKIIVTHSGTFHADEVMACCLLKYLPDYSKYIIIRSRNKEIWKLSDVIVDVGGEFDYVNYKYDHHMVTFNEYFNEKLNIEKILLSASGLVYKYHGKEIIIKLLNDWGLYNEMKEYIESIYNKLYINLFHGIDGVDNGISQYDLQSSSGEDIKLVKKYKESTTYSARVSKLNPSIINSNNENIQFGYAILLAEEAFLTEVKSLVFIQYPSFKVVKTAFNNVDSIHSSGKVIYFDTEVAWKQILLEIEEEMNIKGKLLFAISKTKKEGYRVLTIPKSLGSFDFRKGIYSKWRGLDLEELKKESGIEDIIFVHRTGFIGGAETYESALKMVEISLNSSD